MRIERSRRYLLLLLMVGAMPALCADVSTRPRPQLQVSVFNLGEVGGTTSPQAIIDSLSDWADATPAGLSRSDRWYDIPPGCSADGWVSVVVCGFKQEIDFDQRVADVFVFLFDPDDKAVKAVAHLHYSMLFNSNAMAWYWEVPITRLCSDLQYAWQRGRGERQRTLLRLQIRERHDHEAKVPVLMGATGGGELLSINAAKGMPQISAMAMAAASKVGWRPLLVNKKPQLSLGVTLEYKAASFQLTDRTRPGRRWVGRNVPTADCAAQLIRDFFMASSDGFVFANARVGAQAVLSGQEGGLCVKLRKGAALLNGLTGAEVWSRGEGARPAEAYASRPAGDAPPLVYQYIPQLAVLDLRSGEPKALAPVGADQAWGFDVEEEAVAIAHKTSLSLYRAGKEVWTQDEGEAITCGPLLARQFVLAGTEEGLVIARSLADGKELWRRHTATGLRGPIVMNRDKAVVWSDKTETIYALDIDTGKLRWQFLVGDVLAAPVQTVGERFLVAGKDNRIRLLRARDGKVVAEAAWDNWLIDCRSLDVGGKPVIVCLDITRDLTVLDPRTLAVSRKLRMPEVLLPGIVYLPQAPISWRAANSGEAVLAEVLDTSPDNVVLKTRPAIVVVDKEGFAYMIAPDGRR